MNSFTVYGKPSCPFCEKAVNLLNVRQVPYRYTDVSKDSSARQMLVDKQFKTVPQIYHNEYHIGGYEALVDYLGQE